jgi:exodeoxyribonuclease VII large subunit
MIASFRNRWPSCELVVCDCLVQGDRASGELAAALQRLSTLHGRHMRFDAVILGRGGGSKEDLMAFDSEHVAVAIRDCAMPVVSAVGHETDVSIADRVADARANTPTHAVELLTPNAAELIQSFIRHRDRMRVLLHGKCANIRRRLDFIGNRRDFVQPFDRVRRAEQRLDDIGERLKAALERTLRQREERLRSVSQRLQALSPLNVLGRGYSVVRDANDKVVKRASDVTANDEIRITLAQGELKATVSSAIPVSEQ